MSGHRSLRILLLLLVAGCSASTANQGSSAPAAPPPSRQAREIVLPFDGYELSLGDYYTVSNARDILTRKCMRNSGFDWEIINRPAEVDEARNRRRYGIIEIPVAERFGYHTNDELLDPSGISGKGRARDRGLSSEEARAANSPDTGCAIKASRKLAKDAEADVGTKMLNTLGDQVMANSQKVPDVAQALGRWSECMQRKGMGYSTPRQAVNDDRWWSKGSDRPSKKEIAVAVADVRCKQRTALVKVWFEAEADLQRAAIREHSGYFKKLAESKQRQVTAARAVLDH
ncbi:hypothetical protein ACFW1M_36645 [Streptomyces inhibens]|uniref:hypothetical protein n=1 Tax=Streptomyces inhibens TaxID=2293571 RepID=UPI0036894259